jgi:hypothetical protein
MVKDTKLRGLGDTMGEQLVATPQVSVEEARLEIDFRKANNYSVGLYRSFITKLLYVETIDSNVQPPLVTRVAVENQADALDAYRHPLKYAPKPESVDTTRF